MAFFSRNGLPFSIFDLCYVFLLSASWVLFLKIKLSIAFCEFILFIYITNFLRARYDFVLSVQTLKSVHAKSNMSSYPVKFSSAGVLNLSNKDRANYFD